jgi:hypothetical protein
MTSSALPETTPRAPQPGAIVRSVGFSLAVSALCPYLLFRILEPRFPAESVMPLLYASAFPILGFLFGIMRKRVIDTIALIALLGISVHVAATVLAPSLSVALVLRSFQSAIIGVVFVLSVIIGHPLMFYVVRQTASANAPERRARLDALLAGGLGRAFTTATLVWGLGLIVASGLHVALVFVLSHDTFLLVSPIVGVAVDILLIGWSVRYITRQVALYRRKTG